MNVIPRNILSALLTTIFAVVAITGIMMFFKIRILSTEALHIWLGLVFVLISLLHLMKNWSGFLSYFKKSSTTLSIGVGILVVALFVIVPMFSSHEKGVNPKGQIFGAMMNSPIEKVATFLDMDSELIVKNLSEKSHIIASSKQSVSEIAQANNKSNDEILNVIFSTPKP